MNRKKKQPKVSPGLGENGVKLLLTWNFDGIRVCLFWVINRNNLGDCFLGFEEKTKSKLITSKIKINSLQWLVK